MFYSNSQGDPVSTEGHKIILVMVVMLLDILNRKIQTKSNFQLPMTLSLLQD